jgi:hypothetical protein
MYPKQVVACNADGDSLREQRRRRYAEGPSVRVQLTTKKLQHSRGFRRGTISKNAIMR